MNKNFHPIVSFIYFLSVILFSMIFTHPICLLISLMTGLVHMLIIGNRQKITPFIPVAVATALLTPAFTHAGVTILLYLPSGNPLTLESILYGIASAIMLTAIICHFSCFNKIMTSDKIMYLFGKITPSFSLIFSMILRFVPKLYKQLKETSNAGIALKGKHQNVLLRIKSGIKVLSVTITWCLEDAVDTADSMKSRGYGLAGRTAFSNFCIDKRDIICIIILFFLSLSVLIFQLYGNFYFEYFPYVKYNKITIYETAAFITYFLLSAAPIATELAEVITWKKLKSKI